MKQKNTQKKSWRHLIFVLLSLLLSATASVNAQMRVGGTQLPNANAILDLNKSEGSNGVKGLLLPRVELVGTTNPSPIPFTLNTRGMYVYNVASAGDVTPGVYCNDGSKWVKVAASGSIVINDLSPNFITDIQVNIAKNFTSELGDTIINYVVNNVSDSILAKMNVTSNDQTVDVVRSGSDFDLSVNISVIGDSLVSNPQFITNLVTDSVFFSTLYDDTHLKQMIDSVASLIRRGADTVLVQEIVNKILSDTALISQIFNDTTIVNNIITNLIYDDTHIKQLLDSLLNKTNVIDTIFNTIVYDDSKLQSLIDSLLSKTNLGDTIINYITNHFPPAFGDTILQHITNNVTQALTDSILANVSVTGTRGITITGSGTNNIDVALPTGNAGQVLTYNGATNKWVAANTASAVKQLEVTLGYDITVGNIAYLGVTSAATAAPTVVSVTPIISGDDTMLAAQLNTGVTANVVGNTVKWSLKVNNNNIDNTKRCRIEKVIISYISDDTLTSSTINSYVHTGW
jgi:F0F1-type ATP synthase delta subunit